MATISSAGIGSGLDVNSIITQLMAIEKQPLTTLQTKESKIQSTVSEYGKIKSDISTLRDLATKLASQTTWAQTTANSSSTAVSASTNGSAAGTYAVEVQSLASVQTLATGTAASATALAGAGNLHIELGAWSGVAQGTFTANPTATAVDITVTATDTLADVRDKVNGSNAGVTALIMTDASGSRLLLRSNTTGAANAFRTTVTDADGVNNDASGLSRLAFDPSTGVSVMSQNQVAANAAATINGLAVSSTTNTLASIVDGLTLNLSAQTTGPVTVNVVADTASLKKTITDFAAAYTAVNALIAGDTKYDPTSKTGGILQGDSSAVGLQRALRTLAGSASSASSVFGHLSDVGLQIQGDGSLTVNSTQLDSALGNLAETKKLFAASSLTDPNLDGFAKRFRVAADAMLAIDGMLTTRTDGLGQQLKRNQTDQDNMQTRLTGIEARLRAQYTALDATMAQLTSKSAYVTQQIAAWTAASSSK